MDYEINQKFSELCATGDLDSIKSFNEKFSPDVNSQNKVNKWTALHWGVKRNHVDVVKYLLELGASNDVLNAENKRPSDYAKDINVKSLFNDQSEVLLTEEKSTYVPNYLKYPQFPYVDSKFYEYESKIETKNLNTSMKENISDNTKREVSLQSQMVTIRVKTHLDSDYIEIDVDILNTSLDEFKKLCLEELNLPRDTELTKIKKYQNVLIRNDKDIKRLKNDVEVELFF